MTKRKPEAQLTNSASQSQKKKERIKGRAASRVTAAKTKLQDLAKAAGQNLKEKSLMFKYYQKNPGTRTGVDQFGKREIRKLNAQLYR